MRLIAGLSLLLACTFGHAAAVICPDGLTYVDNNTALCPVNSTNLSVLDITQTTANIVATADAQAPTSTGYQWTSASTHPAGCTSLHYAYADLSSGVTATRQAAEKARQKCMNWKTMVAGTGASSYGSAAISVAGLYTVPITGLTAATTYYTQHFVMGGAGGAGKVGLLSTQQFATAADGGGGVDETTVADAGATPRYIGTGGNDASDGLTHATRWLTLSKVTGALPAGTNIGLFNTSVFSTQAFTISHAGTSLDWNIVGSYKLNGSSVPIWTVDGVFGTSTTDQKAELRGALTQGCLDAGSCAYANTFPIDNYTSFYDQTLKVYDNADYTEIRNIKIAFQRYSSVQIGEGGTKDLTNIIVDGIDLQDNGDTARFAGVTGGVWRNGSILRTNTCWMQRWQSGATGSTAACTGPWGNGVTSYVSNKVLIENNYLKDVFGEAIGLYQNTNYSIVRGNVVDIFLAVCIYLDGASNAVIENNRCSSHLDSTVGYATQLTPYRGGIWTDQEYYLPGQPDTAGNENVTVRNNLMTNMAIAMESSIWAQALAQDVLVNRKASGYFTGNTVVAPYTNSFDFWSYTAGATSTRVPYYHTRNNAFWAPALGGNACLFRVIHAGTTMSYNNHTVTQTGDTDCNGTGDVIGDPSLAVSTIATWTDYTTTIPTFADARPSVGSALRDVGLQTETVVYTWGDFGIAAIEMADYKSGAISATHWVKERYYSATNEVLGATPPIGAMCAAAGC